MIKLPVRCEQAYVNEINIMDSTGRIVAQINDPTASKISHQMWEDAKQIVRALNAGIPKQDKKKKSIEIVEAGVDPKHQTDHCDDCGRTRSAAAEMGGLVSTCSQTEHLTLCRPCYGKRGSSVR